MVLGYLGFEFMLRAAERIRGAGAIYLGPLWHHYFQTRKRLETGGQYSKALRISLNGALIMPYNRPHADVAFLIPSRSGALVGRGPGKSCPLPLPLLGAPGYVI